MPATKISQLSILDDPSGNDLVVAVDVSDTTMGPSGTNKKVYISSIGDSLAFSDLDISGEFSAEGLVHALGVQNESQGTSIYLAHSEPGVGHIASRQGIHTYTTEFTNKGTYYNNSGAYGYNFGLGDNVDPNTPSGGLIVEPKFAQSAEGSFLFEVHLACTFPPAMGTGSIRAITQEYTYDDPHTVTQTFAGTINLATSSTATAPAVSNATFFEEGGLTFYHGSVLEIRNADANDPTEAADGGKGKMQFISSDSNPGWYFYKGGVYKGQLNCDLVNGYFVIDKGFVVTGDRMAVYNDSLTQECYQAQSSGGPYIVGTPDGSTTRCSMTYAGGFNGIDDFETTTVGKGFILKSPDGTRYRISVANGGALSATAV